MHLATPEPSRTRRLLEFRAKRANLLNLRRFPRLSRSSLSLLPNDDVPSPVARDTGGRRDTGKNVSSVDFVETYQ